MFGFSKDKNKIKLTKEKHVITDDAAGFEYEIDTSFKQIRSNAMEVEALAVYASEGRENKHSDVPCVMVLTDSGIYEAIESTRLKMVGDRRVSELPDDQKEKLVLVKYAATSSTERSVLSVSFEDYMTGKTVASCRSSNRTAWTRQRDVDKAIRKLAGRIARVWR